MTPPRQSLPELLSRERFIRLAAHTAFVSDIIGERYAVLVMELDQLDLIRARFGARTADACIAMITRRFQEAMPAEGLGTQIREDAFSMLAFGASNESAALALSDRLHEYMRTPLETIGGEMVLSVSIGIAFTRHGVRAIDALRAAERAVIRVRQNGGDATFIGRVVPTVTPSFNPVTRRSSRELVGVEG